MEMREGAQTEMAFVLERDLAAYAGAGANENKLEVSVIFTSVKPTLRALQEAALLATRLAARITLLVPQIVPYPLPLSSPPVLLEFNEKRFFTLVNESHVETSVRIYLCRDRLQTVTNILRPRSLVVLGARRRWWPNGEARLAKQLRSAGHEVVVVETE